MNFQTPTYICKYMISLIPDGVKTILEPTPGLGNIISELNGKYDIIAPNNYFDWKQKRVDCIVMNPPFTDKETIYNNAPEYIKKLKGAKIGYWFLFHALDLSDNIIALVPWYTIINSKKRVDVLQRFGLISITNLPRSVFKNVRVQTCILQLKNGYCGPTEFKQY